MTWAATIAVLRTHLTDAGAAVTPVFGLIRMSYPQAANRQICAWYNGDGPNPYESDTLAMANFGEKVTVKAFSLLTSLDQAAAEADELAMQAVARAITSRLRLDTTLGGTCEGFVIGDAVADTESLFGALMRTLTISLTVASSSGETLAR
jgi:hypothetical protein